MTVLKLVFQNNIEPISCKLIKLEQIQATFESGTLIVIKLRDINRIRSSFHNSFILTNDNMRTCFANCVYTYITISTHNSSFRYHTENYDCKLDFRVLHKGSRSIPIPESELIGCDISMHNFG